jgi:hypothetical protein
MESLNFEDNFVSKISNTAHAHFKRSEVIRQEITYSLKQSLIDCDSQRARIES